MTDRAMATSMSVTLIRPRVAALSWLTAIAAIAARFKKQQPVFAVERWCFRKADDVNEAYSDVIAKMKKAGVTFCK